MVRIPMSVYWFEWDLPGAFFYKYCRGSGSSSKLWNDFEYHRNFLKS